MEHVRYFRHSYREANNAGRNLSCLRANVIIIVVRYTYGMEKGSRGLTVGFRTAAAANPYTAQLH
jgi:hypothetical protein